MDASIWVAAACLLAVSGVLTRRLLADRRRDRAARHHTRALLGGGLPRGRKHRAQRRYLTPEEQREEMELW